MHEKLTRKDTSKAHEDCSDDAEKKVDGESDDWDKRMM
jgi:hypothetical protein